MPRTHHAVHLGCLVSTFALTAGAVAGAAQSGLEIVAVEGLLSPEGEEILVVRNPLINASGLVAWDAEVRGPSGALDSVWTKAPGASPALIIKQGDFPQFGPNAVVTSANKTVVTDTGTVGLTLRIVDPSFPEFASRGLYRYEIGTNTFTPIVFSDVPYPDGNPDEIIDSVNGPQISASGVATFILSVRDLETGDRFGAVCKQPDAASPWAIALRDREVINIPGQGDLRFDLDRETLLEDGRIAYDLEAFDPMNSDPTTNRSFWRENASGDLELLLRNSDPAPGTSATFELESFYSGSFLRDGRLTLRARLRDTFGLADDGLWTETASGLELVFRDNDFFPPAGPTARMLLLSGIEKNSSSTLILEGRIYGSGISGDEDLLLLRWTPLGGLGIVVQEGDQAAGLPADVVIGEVESSEIAEDGTVAFIAGLTGAGVTFENDSALFVVEPGGTPRLVLRTADMIDVDPGATFPDVRTIDDIAFSSRNSFASDNRLLISLRFDDSTEGIVTIPPPSACAGDFDDDADVDLGDFGVFGSAFGSALGDATYNAGADFDNDGDVDLGDFGVFGAEFGRIDCLP